MGRIRIITDTASDITRQQAKEMDIEMVPISILFGTDEMPMETEEDFQNFFERLYSEKSLPSTSQPSPELYVSQYEEAREKDEDVLVLTLSGGLSGTVNAARLAQDVSGYDRVTVVDTRQAIITQRMLVERAVKRRDEGRSVEEIAQEIIEVRDRMVVCGVLDTLTCLRKGGRIPPGLDVVGNALRLKPVIELKDSVLVPLGVARGMKKGRDFLYREFEAAPIDTDWPIYTGYTYDREEGEAFRQTVMERYNLSECQMYPVGGVIGTHVGKNCVALAFVRKA